HATLFDRGKHHGRVGKELLSMSLDEACRWRTNADNQVERLFSREGLQVLNEWPLRVLIAGAGAHQRVLGDIQWPKRLPFQLRSDQFGVFAPWLKIASERMKQHHTLGLGRKS